MRPIYDCHAHATELDLKKSIGMLDVMSSIGVERAALLALTYKSTVSNLYLLDLKRRYGRIKLSVFGMINNRDMYKDIPFETQARAIMELGCDGIKMMYNPIARKALGYGVDDERYEKMFSYLEENGIPVIMHVNDPESYWVVRDLTPTEIARDWGYFKEGFLSKEEIYDETFRMLDRHPRLKVVLAHFYFLSRDIDEATRVMETYPEVCFDLTPGWEMYVGFSEKPEEWRTFFKKYSDRILFGTDSADDKRFNAEINLLVRMALERDGEFLMPCYRECTVTGLGLDGETLDKIYYKNYERLFGNINEVNLPLMREYAERVLSDMKKLKGTSSEGDILWLRDFLGK